MMRNSLKDAIMIKTTFYSTSMVTLMMGGGISSSLVAGSHQLLKFIELNQMKYMVPFGDQKYVTTLTELANTTDLAI